MDIRHSAPLFKIDHRIRRVTIFIFISIFKRSKFKILKLKRISF